MAKKILLFLLFLSMTLAACAHRAERWPRVKKEQPLYRILAYRGWSSDKINYEDKWFKYAVVISYVNKGRFSNVNVLIGGCPVGSAFFTVYDKEKERFVREETVTQRSCGRCHPR